MSDKQKQVLYDSPEAASVQTVTGWVSRTGVFFGDDEHQARVFGCTHFRCSCGVVATSQTCATCNKQAKVDRHRARVREAWDGQMIYSEEADHYFPSPEEARLYVATHALDFEEMRFVLCDPHYLSPLDSFAWSNDLPDGSDLSPKVWAAIDVLNKVIESEPPSMWYPSNIAWNGESK